MTQRIAFEWGNLPMQPNDERTNVWMGPNHIIPPELGTGDSHIINATAWDQYPDHNGSRNYMVTGVEFLPNVTIDGQNNIYEYTSQNNLKAGDVVNITRSGWGNSTSRTVLYADHNKFRTTDELGEGKLTGLLGRVDVTSDVAGKTREGFFWPSNGVCYNNPKAPGNRWQDMIEYLRSAGVNPEYLKEATFTGGSDKYDWQGNSYDSGIIFWSYIPASEIIWIEPETGSTYTGKDFDGMVIGSNAAPGEEISASVSSDNYFFTAFTNDPSKNNTSGWL